MRSAVVSELGQSAKVLANLLPLQCRHCCRDIHPLDVGKAFLCMVLLSSRCCKLRLATFSCRDGAAAGFSDRFHSEPVSETESPPPSSCPSSTFSPSPRWPKIPTAAPCLSTPPTLPCLAQRHLPCPAQKSHPCPGSTSPPHPSSFPSSTSSQLPNRPRSPLHSPSISALFSPSLHI